MPVFWFSLYTGWRHRELSVDFCYFVHALTLLHCIGLGQILSCLLLWWLQLLKSEVWMVLQIDRVFPQHFGEYYFHADNEAGSDEIKLILSRSTYGFFWAVCFLCMGSSFKSIKVKINQKLCERSLGRSNPCGNFQFKKWTIRVKVA